MIKCLIVVSLAVFGQCLPTIVDSGGHSDQTIAILGGGSNGGGSYGSDFGSVGQGGGQDWQSAALSLGFGGGHGDGIGHDTQEAASSYGGGYGHGGEGSIVDGDFHHGVSLVSTGGDHKGKVFDLTNQGDSHQGPFGGSFVASSKYSAGGHGGGGGIGGSHGGYGVAEGTGFAEHYSDVLGASDSLGSYGGGGNSGSHGYEALSHGSFGEYGR